MSERWSSEKRHAFALFGPLALCVIVPDKAAAVTLYNNDGTVFRRIGGNQASWAVKIGLSRQPKDTLTAVYRNPWVKMQLRARLWCSRLDEAKALDHYGFTLLSQAAEQAGYPDLLNGFINCGPKFDPTEFQRKLQMVAKRLQIVVWTEKDLSSFLDRVLVLAKRKGVQIVDGRGRKIMSHAPAFQRLCDRAVDDERRRQFPPVQPKELV